MLKLEDFTDRTLPITESHIAAGNEFIKLIAGRYGVTADKICDPLTYAARRLGVLHGYIGCCLDYIGQDPVSHEGYSDEDVYVVKLRAFRQQLNDLLKVISVADFTGVGEGSSIGGGYHCIGVWRA